MNAPGTNVSELPLEPFEKIAMSARGSVNSATGSGLRTKEITING